MAEVGGKAGSHIGIVGNVTHKDNGVFISDGKGEGMISLELLFAREETLENCQDIER